MKHTILAFVLSLLFFSVPAITLAGTDHDHGHSHEPITGTEAQFKATQRVKQLVETGKIEATWANIESSTISQKDYGHGPEWMIIFKNDKASDSTKQTLYLFYSQDGHYLAANFDGN